jgi:hypothetical protein
MCFISSSIFLSIKQIVLSCIAVKILYAKDDVGFRVNDVRVESGWLRRIYLLVIQEERKKYAEPRPILFYMLHHDEKEEKAMCVCTWNERILVGAAAECASARRETDVMKAVVLQR